MQQLKEKIAFTHRDCKSVAPNKMVYIFAYKSNAISKLVLHGISMGGTRSADAATGTVAVTLCEIC